MNNRTIAITVDNDSILSLNNAYTYLSEKLDMIYKRTLEVRAEQAAKKEAAAPRRLDYIAMIATASQTRCGRYHTLTVKRNGLVECSCEGFVFRNTCRHAAEYRGSDAHLKLLTSQYL